MIDQRPQHGGGGDPAERADESPVLQAGLPPPAAVAGGDPRGVVEKMRGLGQHEILAILPRSITAARTNSMTREAMVVRISASPRAARPAPATPAADRRAPARSRSPGRIRGWCDRRGTTASARR